MADRGDTHYFTPTLNVWFLGSSILLLLTVGWMMIDDWNASWKVHQRDFRRVEAEKARQAAADIESDADYVADRDQLQAALDAAQAAMDSKQSALDEALAEVETFVDEKYVTEGAFKAAKAQFNWTRYNFEEDGAKGDLTDKQKEVLEADSLRVAETGLEFEKTEERLAAAQARVDALQEEVNEATAALAARTREVVRLEQRVEALEPSDAPTKLANLIRDTPGLDFIGPKYKVKKQVLENLTFDLNFTKKTRIDMCTTCHLAVDREGYETETDEQPLRTHPRLDLYLTSKSPHPMKDVGCTICHRGAGEALDFIRVDHRPSTPTQAEEWHDDHHWHKQHHWDYPMLANQHVEASCVQCHKTSMELIAEDAPKVTEGYRLFERYGCYSCHKVDWFPTNRKPGPSLVKMNQKLKDDWVGAWITDPKAFRPTTWMPQFFHLENYEPDEVIAVSEYGEGPPVLGKAWNESAVAAISTYIQTMASGEALPEIPVEGDAYRGREAFRVSGCLACHNLEPYEGEDPKTLDVAYETNEHNTKGPNLRGVATKINAEWLYAWIKDPAKYWPDTNMPNLRLSDQDAADITAYIMEDPDAVFTDVPQGWTASYPDADIPALKEQARWFYGKLGRTEVERRLNGENPEHRWDEPKTLHNVVGEAYVMHQGCFSCHTITGMEQAMPIGAELSNWGSKTVDKLDFGYAYRKELGGRPKLDHHYREGWLARKLDAPRSYDLEKVKNPKEKLRMPWFDFTDEEIDSLVTFVIGLVDDEVQLAKMEPTPGELAMDYGKRVVRQKNCMACHVVEPAELEFDHEDSGRVTAAVEPLLLEDQTLPFTLLGGMDSLMEQVAQYEEDMEEEVEELGFRLLENVPGVGRAGENFFLEKDALVGLKPAQGGSFVHTVVDYYYNGIEQFDAEAEDEDDAYYSVTADPDGEGRVEDVDGEFRAYYEEAYDKLRWTFAPPVLINEGGKVQREWFYGFLHDVVPLRKQMRVKMPSFTYRDGEAEAIADYFAHDSAKNWPSRYAKTARYALGVETQDAMPEDANWPEQATYREGGTGLSLEEVAMESKMSPSNLAAIEDGNKLATKANFDKLLTWGDAKGFVMNGPVDPSYDLVDRRSQSYLEAHGDSLAAGAALAGKGVNCYQCHWFQGNPPEQAESPIAWAPDLSLTRERLREEWVERWLWDPGMIYPGTAMPANFQGVPPQYQDVYPNSTNNQQIQAVTNWLYNLDRLGTN